MIYKFGVVKHDKPNYIDFIYDKTNNIYRLITTNEFKKGDLIYKIKPTCIYVSPVNDRVFYYLKNDYVEVKIACIDINNVFRFRYFDTFISYSEQPNCRKIYEQDGSFRVLAKRDIDIGELLSVENTLENI